MNPFSCERVLACIPKALLLIYASLLLNGCALIFSSRKYATFVAPGKGTKIEVQDPGRNEGYVKIGTDSAGHRLRNMSSSYNIRQKRDGYVTTTTSITRQRFNKVKYLDFIVPAVCGIILLNSIYNIDAPEALTAIAFVPGTWGWLSILVGPYKVYEKRYLLPEMQPVPKRLENERHLFVDKVNFNIDAYNLRFNSQYGTYSSGNASTEDLKIKNLNFNKDLNDMLQKMDYTDTTKKFFGNAYNSVYIDCDITELQVNYMYNNNMNVTLTTVWKIKSFFSRKEIFSKTIHSIKSENVTYSSNYYSASYKTDFFDKLKEAIVNGLEISIADLLNDPNLKPHIQIGEDKYAKEYKDWDTLTLRNDSLGYAKTLSEATKAVVTVKMKEGHGSGCIVSKDGYIITNYHILEDSTSVVEVIFENGNKMYAKVVRSNPQYDLTLLKVDSAITVKPLFIYSSYKPEIGSEVYAIGTPADIDLGQTLSKGIISGKRKLDERIYIQTDVSINKGNSGGALVSKDVKLIGIVNAKIIGFGYEGVGFAIPSSYIEEALKIKSN